MADIRKYVIVDENDVSEDFEYDTLAEAREAAEGRPSERLAIIERVYEYDDSGLVWTSTGDDVWPPTVLVSEDEYEDYD